jgi:formylmethanofuran dehydrogenase subunit D
LKVVLLTVRTIEQGVGKERGKLSEEYFESVALCYVDPDDLNSLGIKEGTNIRVSTGHGSVIVKTVSSQRGPHRGVVFLPYGPWANAVTYPDTDSNGMPSLKGIQADINVAPEEPVLSLSELLRKQFGKH